MKKTPYFNFLKIDLGKNSNSYKYLLSKKNLIRFFVSFFVLLNLIFWLKNYAYFSELYKIGGGFWDSFVSVYDISNTWTTTNFLIIIFTTILSSINISLLLEFTSLQNSLKIKTKVKKENFLISSAITLAVLASHCASCGVILLGSFVSLGFLSYLPYGGVELSVLAIMILLWTIYNLIKKINNPYVC